MATKNNLDVGGEAPVHKDLAGRYRIEGTVYDLGQIVAAVKGEQSNDDWNKRTLGDRLDAVKAYIKDMNAEKVDDSENTAGDGETVKDGTGQIIGGGAESGEDAMKALEQLHAANGAVGPVDTLRAFNQDGEADVVEKALAELDGVKQQIKDVRDRLGLKDDTADILEAVDALLTKASEAEQRATVAEQDASTLRGKVKRLEERSTRDKPLHGFVDDLKPPY